MKFFKIIFFFNEFHDFIFLVDIILNVTCSSEFTHDSSSISLLLEIDKYFELSSIGYDPLKFN